MILSVHQPQYLPWLGYFDKIAKSDLFVFLDQVQYKPREFQNRNRIRTDKDSLWLSVPIVSKGLGRQKISEVLVDNDLPWQRKHLLSLKTNYAKAEFFQQHLGFFEEVYSKKWDKLVDLNIHIINYILKQLTINTPIYLESDLNINKQSTQRIIEICQRLKADTYLSGIGGKGYLAEDKFPGSGIKLVYQEFIHPVYKQQFMKNQDDFLPYMSVMDLLFNQGPRSRAVLKL